MGMLSQILQILSEIYNLNTKDKMDHCFLYCKYKWLNTMSLFKNSPLWKQNKYKNQDILNYTINFDNTSNKQWWSAKDKLKLGVLYSLKNNAVTNLFHLANPYSDLNFLCIAVRALFYILTNKRCFTYHNMFKSTMKMNMCFNRSQNSFSSWTLKNQSYIWKPKLIIVY